MGHPDDAMSQTVYAGEKTSLLVMSAVAAPLIIVAIAFISIAAWIISYLLSLG